MQRALYPAFVGAPQGVCVRVGETDLSKSWVDYMVESRVPAV